MCWIPMQNRRSWTFMMLEWSLHWWLSLPTHGSPAGLEDISSPATVHKKKQHLWLVLFFCCPPCSNLNSVSLSISGLRDAVEGGWRMSIPDPFFPCLIFNVSSYLMHFPLLLAAHLSLLVGACESLRSGLTSVSGVKIIHRCHLHVLESR